MVHYKSIFISDTHLGSKAAKTKILLHFLKNTSSDNLYLVGDIIDAWKIKQNNWYWNKTQSKVVRQVLKMSTNENMKIVYITGNHDEFLRQLVSHNFSIGNLTVVNHCTHIGIDGKRYLVVHGDMFDGITRLGKWISLLGDSAYDFIVQLNTWFNEIRHRFGLHYWSFSKWIKHRVKKAITFIFEYEKNLAGYCKRKGYDGVICGHIHFPEIKMIGDISYMNTGDWVENCSAVVEHIDGSWEVLYWKTEDKEKHVDIDNHSTELA